MREEQQCADGSLAFLDFWRWQVWWRHNFLRRPTEIAILRYAATTLFLLTYFVCCLALFQLEANQIQPLQKSPSGLSGINSMPHDPVASTVMAQHAAHSQNKVEVYRTILSTSSDMRLRPIRKRNTYVLSSCRLAQRLSLTDLWIDSSLYSGIPRCFILSNNK